MGDKICVKCGKDDIFGRGMCRRCYDREHQSDPNIRERMRRWRKEYIQRPEYTKKRREYYHRPEVKERIRRYNQLPKVRERVREYNHRPEVKKRKREYNQRPEVIERRRKYYQRPEAIEHRKEFYQRPDIKKRYLGYNAKRRDGFFFSIDVLVGMLREAGGEMQLSRLPPYPPIKRALKIGIVEVEGDVVRLKKTPMLCAFDGFFEEKERQILREEKIKK